MHTEGDGIAADMLMGAVASSVGVWVMDRVDWFNYRHEDPEARRRTRQARPGGETLRMSWCARRGEWQAHARGLVAHLVYGLVTDTVLNVLKGAGRSARGR